MDRLLQGIEHEACRGAGADYPAHDSSGKGVDHEGDVDEPGPGMDIGEVDHPKRIWSADAELTVDLIQWARCLRVADRGDRRLAPAHAGQAHGAHQPLHGALGDGDAPFVQRVFDLAQRQREPDVTQDHGPNHCRRTVEITEGTGLVPVSCRSPISLCHLGFECERADTTQI